MRALCNEHSPATQFYTVKQMQAAGVALRAQQYTVTVRQVCWCCLDCILPYSAAAGRQWQLLVVRYDTCKRSKHGKCPAHSKGARAEICVLPASHARKVAASAIPTVRSIKSPTGPLEVQG